MRKVLGAVVACTIALKANVGCAGSDSSGRAIDLSLFCTIKGADGKGTMFWVHETLLGENRLKHISYDNRVCKHTE